MIKFGFNYLCYYIPNMKKFLITTILKILSLLPLPAIRALGSAVGILVLKLSKNSSRRLRKNLLITGLATEANIDLMVRKTAEAMGMTLAEAALIAWQKNYSRINKLFEVDESFTKVKQLLASGQNIVFLTPHIGNFELAIKYFALNLPMNINILYKPEKDPILNAIMLEGRTEPNVTPVPTNRKGVLSLMKHFKSGGTIGILPDNVASGGDGEWVKFFGHYVYATSLAAKICQTPNSCVMFVQNLRTPNGFKSRCIPFNPSSSDTHNIIQEMYGEIEKMVLEAPEQYYWSYDRFRDVTGAKPKPNDYQEINN